MSRRKIRRAAGFVMVDWTPDIAQLFDLVPQDWSPPAKARISAGKAHNTVSARFKTPAGFVSTARVRIERVKGVLTVTEASMSQTFTLVASKESAR